MIYCFPVTFAESLQIKANRYLKKWAGLARCANPSILYRREKKGRLKALTTHLMAQQGRWLRWDTAMQLDTTWMEQASVFMVTRTAQILSQLSAGHTTNTGKPAELKQALIGIMTTMWIQ